MKRLLKAEDLGRRPALRWIFGIASLLLWSLGAGVAALYFAARAYGYELFFSYWSSPLLLLLNLLPGLLLALLLFGITNRVWPAVFGSGVIVLLGAIVDYFKLQTRSEPLIATDLQYIAEAANISARYSLTVTPTMFLCALALVIATLLALMFLKARFRRAWPRLLLVLLVLAAGAGAYFGLYRSETIYEKTENLDVEFSIPYDHPYQMNQWNETDQFIGRGFWYPFLYSTAELGDSRPTGYSPAKARALLERYEGADIPQEKKVSVISVMLEAYADFSVFPQLQFEIDPYAAFHALQDEGISGWLDVNIFAGGTIDTERCYMSGSPEMYNYRFAADSYVRWFAGQGYRTEFCHPGYNWFYNRENVAEELGFERSYFGESFFPFGADEQPMMDEQFFPMLLDLFHASAAEGEPYFNMSVTYQNHGPYVADYYYDAERSYVRGEMNEESSIILNNYLWGIERTDAALRSFTDALRDDPEPVVLVLFGDHKPWLGVNSSVYTDIGIDLRYWDARSQCEYCRTPYLIWANAAAKAALGSEVQGDGGEFSPCYLMMKLFDACGWEGDAYMQALRDAYPEADLISPRLRLYRSNGRVTQEPETLPESAQTAIEGLRYMSYYRMNDAMR